MKLFLVLFLFFASEAMAADIGCGRDTDRNGSVDHMCPGGDTDFDGYTVAQGDCDDTEWQIYPGTLTSKGCSAGSFRVCNRDGSGYGSCTALSDITTTQIGQAYGGTPLNIYWISASGTTGGSGGTYANPWALRCIGNDNGETCAHTVTAGDAFLLKAGTYNSYYTEHGEKHQLYIFSRTATATNPIYVIGDPTGTAELVGQGTGIYDEIPIIRIDAVEHIAVDNITMHGGYGSGVFAKDSTYMDISRMNIYSLDGRGGYNNLSGISMTSLTHGAAHHNLISDVYNSTDPTNENNTGIVIFGSATGGDDQNANYNVVYTTLTGGAGRGIKYKHGSANCTSFQMIGNFVDNTYDRCLQFNQKYGTIKNNLLSNCNGNSASRSGFCIDNVDGGGYPVFSNTVVEYNTCYNSPFMEFLDPSSEGTSEAFGSPALTTRYNVIQDEQTTYTCDGCFMVRYDHYGTQSVYNDVVGNNKAIWTNNCFYNSASTALRFSVFGGSSGTFGRLHESWSAWTGASYDSGSYNENPSLDSIKNATSTHCAGWGYLGNAPAAASTKTTLTIGKSGKRVIRR